MTYQEELDNIKELDKGFAEKINDYSAKELEDLITKEEILINFMVENGINTIELDDGSVITLEESVEIEATDEEMKELRFNEEDYTTGESVEFEGLVDWQFL